MPDGTPLLSPAITMKAPSVPVKQESGLPAPAAGRARSQEPRILLSGGSGGGGGGGGDGDGDGGTKLACTSAGESVICEVVQM